MLKELKTVKKLTLYSLVLLLSFSCKEKSETNKKITKPINQNKIINSIEINYQNKTDKRIKNNNDSSSNENLKNDQKIKIKLLEEIQLIAIN